MSIINEQPHEGEAQRRLQQLKADVDAAQPKHNAAAFLAAIVESSDDAIVSKSQAMLIQLTAFPEEREPPQEWSQSQDDAEGKERGSEPSEPKSGLPVVSSFGDAPSSAP